MYGLAIGTIPLIISVLTLYLVGTKGKKWSKLIWLEVLIFLASVVLIGSKSIDVNVAATVCIFTSIAGMYIFTIGTVPNEPFSALASIVIYTASYALGFVISMIRFFISVA